MKNIASKNGDARPEAEPAYEHAQEIRKRLGKSNQRLFDRERAWVALEINSL